MKAPLGFDSTGNPLDLPEAATAWRVRRALGRPGRPQTVYDPETGRQLELPIAATIEDLRACVPPARYRLEAIDAENKALVPAVVAFVEVLPASDDDAGDAQPRALSEKEIISGTRVMKTLERQADALCRVVEAMARAFGPVQPVSTPDLAELAQLAKPAEDAEPSTNNAAKLLTPEAIQSFGMVAQQLMAAWQSMSKGGAS